MRRRVRVQARQIYCFAQVADLLRNRDEGLEYLLAKAKSPDRRPGFVHLLDRDGSTMNATRDTYDHAFVLLALSTVYRLSHDAQVRDEITSLLNFLDADLRSPHGGFVEGFPATFPRRQNPQMHLFEAMIATFDATGDPVFKDRADELYGLFVANLHDPQRQVLGEYFEEDRSKIEPVSVEPGHQAQWVWLLRGFGLITGCPTAGRRAQLLSSALRYRDDVTGCLFDEGDSHGNIRKFSRRCWPRTEIAKAWIAQAEAREPKAADEVREALAGLYRHYLRHPVLGGWYDQFDRDGRSLVDFIPAPSFYHILRAIAEAERVLCWQGSAA